MNNPDKLDRILRRDAAGEGIADAAFTARVMAAVPRGRRAPP